MNHDHVIELIFPLLGLGCMLLYILHVAIKTGWLAEFLTNCDRPSAETIKQQSDEMLAEMDRNVAERKARKTDNGSAKL